MLSKRPEDRYQTPAEVAEAVTPYILAPEARDLEFDPGGWSIRAGASTTWAMLCKFARRNKAFTAAAVTAIVLLAWSSVINFRARRALEQTTRDAVPALVQSTRLSAEKQDFQSALRQVNLALAYDPDNSEARLLKGQVLIVEKDFARARDELQRYLRQQPEDTAAKHLLELCSRKQADEPGSLLTLAHVLEQQKMPALAEGLLKPLAPTSVEARAELLKFYRKRIDKSWPGLPSHCFGLDPAGIYSLDFDGYGSPVGTLEPLRGMPLTHLSVAGIPDLAPLQGMPLVYLRLRACKVDLSLLKGMRLTELYLTSCSGVRDLSPLRGMPLTSLHLSNVEVRDLSPLKDMPLTSLGLFGTDVRDLSPLKDHKLTHIFLPQHAIDKGMGVLRQMPTLTKIQLDNGWIMPADEFWKQWDAGKFPQYKKDKKNP
jgi:hypothetical protein